MNRPSEFYAERLAAGDLRSDPAQEAGLAILDQTFDQLVTPARRRWWQLGRRQLASVASVYLHGPVGRGKSLIMDLFVEALKARDDTRAQVRRVHFHAFMLGVHQRIHELQQAGQRGDPMPTLAQEIGGQSQVLCFDEFVVNNIADAMILGRLFEALWQEGLTLVATSNFAPEDLYKGGLHRARFLPFIDLIQQKMRTVSVAGQQDYRTLQSDLSEVFFNPISFASRISFEDAYKRLAYSEPGRPVQMSVGSRQVSLPWATQELAMARFADLCERPLGAADYLALTEQFKGLALDEVPALDDDRRNEASRFKVLIDTLYEAGTLLIMRSAAPIETLYQGAKSVEFSRTISRLQEMRGRAYVDRALERLDQGPSKALSAAQTRA